MRDIYTEMVENWGAPRVRRSDVARFSFGVISGKTIANLGASGHEVPPSEQVGKHRVYRAEELAAWLRKKYGTKAA